MKARINLTKFPEGRPGYYAMMEDEAQYERVKNYDLLYERTKRVTHYLVPASVFERLLNLDRASEKMCGKWEEEYDDGADSEYPSAIRCSCCKEYQLGGSYKPNFCPECGADMREVEEYDAEDPNKPEETYDSTSDERAGT